MKLFIYYSVTNNGDIVAEKLKTQGYEIRKVSTKYKYPKNRILSIIIGGYKAMRNMKDELIDFDDDIKKYDEIVIGSPIWNDRLCPAINTVLSKLDLTGKNIKFILYSGSGKTIKAQKKIRSLYETNIIILKEPKINKEELKKIWYNLQWGD